VLTDVEIVLTEGMLPGETRALTVFWSEVDPDDLVLVAPVTLGPLTNAVPLLAAAGEGRVEVLIFARGEVFEETSVYLSLYRYRATS
jgi:hypothetical protein